MNIFITGATGHIGGNLAIKLANEGHTIHALCRSPHKTKFLEHPNIHLFRGDVLEANSLEEAMRGCRQVYHLAGFTGVWAGKPEFFYSTNIGGLVNVLEAAKNLDVQKVVVTSTAGTIGPSLDGNTVNESTIRSIHFFNDYETSKYIAEEKVQHYVRRGLPVVIVNPSRVYGPGKSYETKAVNRLIELYFLGKWHIIPGDGSKIGNYVYIEDVVNGHIKAMEYGKPGEKYLLGGEDASYNQFFKILKQHTGKKQFLLKTPLSLMLLFSSIQKLLANWFNFQPIITPDWVKRYYYNWPISSQKARQQLNYKITPFHEGIPKSISWLKQKHR